MNLYANIHMNIHMNVRMDVHLYAHTTFHLKAHLNLTMNVYMNDLQIVHQNFYLNDPLIVSATIHHTGCFRKNEIIFYFISQPIKHFNSFDMSHIFTESIAFRYIISKIISLHKSFTLEEFEGA